MKPLLEKIKKLFSGSHSKHASSSARRFQILLGVLFLLLITTGVLHVNIFRNIRDGEVASDLQSGARTATLNTKKLDVVSSRYAQKEKTRASIDQVAPPVSNPEI